MPLLELDGCGLTLGGRAVLDGVTISLARGASLGVTGMSGAGKTMLALAIGGLLPAGAQQGGEIRFDGMPLPSSERVMVRLRGQRIGLLLGDGSMGLDPLRPVGKQAPAEALAAIGLGGRATALPHALSEAEQRRALLAQALAAHPDLLVLDEPAHGLDPVAAHALHALIAAQQKQHGFALLLLGRDHRTIAALCPEIAVLHQGRIVETGPATDVFVRPQHDHTRDLVAAAKLKTRTLTRPPIGADLLTVSGVQFPLSGGTGAVAELSFVVRSTEALAIIGSAGAGKTRLGRIVAGLERAPQGQLALEHDLYRGDNLPAHRRRDVSLVPAEPEASFDPRLPVGASVTEPLRLEPQLIIDEQAERLMELVRAVGIDPERLTQLPASFTTPELYRLALARALIARPRLLVIDEPAERFDLIARSELVALMSRLRSDYGLTCLLLVRDIDTARALADRLLVIENGKVVEEGKPGELIAEPKHPLTRAFVEARPAEIRAVTQQDPTSPAP